MKGSPVSRSPSEGGSQSGGNGNTRQHPFPANVANPHVANLPSSRFVSGSGTRKDDRRELTPNRESRAIAIF